MSLLGHYLFILILFFLVQCIHFLWRRDLEPLKRGGYNAGCPLLGDTSKPHFSYFLRREERSKEASTSSKASPYMGRMQLKNQFLLFRVLV